jgi:hypothetical protein
MSDGSNSDTSEEHSEDTTWVTWFCSIKGNEFFCEVDEEYLADTFNLSGLKDEVGAYYEEALDTILDSEAQSDYNEDHQQAVDNAAEFLYGLIHARFILTAKGLQLMNEKFHSCDFGRCHNVRCDGQALLRLWVVRDEAQLRRALVHLHVGLVELVQAQRFLPVLHRERGIVRRRRRASADRLGRPVAPGHGAATAGARCAFPRRHAHAATGRQADRAARRRGHGTGRGPLAGSFAAPPGVTAPGGAASRQYFRLAGRQSASASEGAGNEHVNARHGVRPAR